jgi:protein arginine kinase activator
MGLSEERCDQCKQPAAVRFTQAEGGRVQRGYLCTACARARGLLDIPSPPAASAARCPSCGLSFAEFQHQGRLGCPECYAAFATELQPLLRQVHGRVEQGDPGSREPVRAAVRRLAELRAALDVAVRAEEYERAAAVRDEIRALEQAETAPGEAPPDLPAPPSGPEAH